MAFLFEPLQFEFFRNALIAGIMVGALCGLLGVFTILRGISYIGHGLSHAAFGGAVIGQVLGVTYYLSAFTATIFAALLAQRITSGRRLRADASIGIVTTVLFAIGVVFISLDRRIDFNLEAALFGNLLGVKLLDLWLISAVTSVGVPVIAILYRRLMFSSFDEDTAAAMGIARGSLQFIFTFLLALCVLVSMGIVGVTLITAALIIPAATIRMLTNSFHKMVLLSPLLGASCALIGLYISYYFDFASGASIIIIEGGCFICAWFYSAINKYRSFHVHPHQHGSVEHTHLHEHQGEHEHPHRTRPVD